MTLRRWKRKSASAERAGRGRGNGAGSAAYEPEEDETVTAAVIKKALKELIDDLKGSTGNRPARS